MTGANIVGFRPEPQDELIEENVAPDAPEADYDALTDRSAWDRLLPVLLGTAALVWIGFVTWAIAAQADAFANLAMIIGAASAPLALLGILGLLALRTSRREAHRFLATAQGMRFESARLESKVAELTARIDANREALSDQAVQLTQIGEEAAARLATIAASFRSDG